MTTSRTILDDAKAKTAAAKARSAQVLAGCKAKDYQLDELKALRTAAYKAQDWPTYRRLSDQINRRLPRTSRNPKGVI